MNKTLALAAFLGLTAVAAAAYANHGIDPKNTIKVISAVRLQQVHTLVILALGLAGYTALPEGLKGKFNIVTVLFTLGIVMFSGNIYLHYFLNFKALGFLVPFGGMTIMAGWLALGWAAVRHGGKG